MLERMSKVEDVLTKLVIMEENNMTTIRNIEIQMGKVAKQFEEIKSDQFAVDSCSRRLTRTPSCVSTNCALRTPLLLFQRSPSSAVNTSNRETKGALAVVFTPTIKSAIGQETPNTSRRRTS